MILSKQTIYKISNNSGLEVPIPAMFLLPEKVLQFGTGVLLRGLPDYFIDNANKQGIFNGRIVMVKSTNQGATVVFSRQDNLYTQIVRGIKNGKNIEEAIINASISRVLSAADEWTEILTCAANPQLQIVISNTTEVGIALLKDDNVHAKPPISFPGKLLSFLYERYKIFNGTLESGMVIIPAELITYNGTKLKDIVVKLALENKLENDFIEWLNTANDFCNSLVDRIVPGALSPADKSATEEKLGYKDDLMIMSEAYCLWAIETSKERTNQILSFSKADDAVIIVPDLTKYSELKFRLLNGAHTATCALAILAGFTTVKQAMENEAFANFITNTMKDEIAPAICSHLISNEDTTLFCIQVLDRFRNPFIEHQWLNITAQYTSKIEMRIVPVLMQYYQQNSKAPKHLALGFAAYLLFIKTGFKENGTLYGEAGNRQFEIKDDKAICVHDLMHNDNANITVTEILKDKYLWGVDLHKVNGFSEMIQQYIQLLQKNGALFMLTGSFNHKTDV